MNKAAILFATSLAAGAQIYKSIKSIINSAILDEMPQTMAMAHSLESLHDLHHQFALAPETALHISNRSCHG